MVCAECLCAVETSRISFWCEAILVGVTANAGDTLDGEIKWDGRKAGSREEGNKKRSETAVDMER